MANLSSFEQSDHFGFEHHHWQCWIEVLVRYVHKSFRWYSCHRRFPARHRSVSVKKGGDDSSLTYIKARLIFLIIWKAFGGLLVIRCTLCVVSADLIDEVGVDLVVRRARVHDGGGCHC